MKFIAAALGAIVMGVALAALAQQVVIEKDTELRGEPDPKAPVVGKVRQGTTGQATDRKGAWVNVKTPDGAGWMFSFNVRFAGEGSKGAAAGGGDSGVLSRLTGPRTNVSVTSTLGSRGLDKDILAQGSYHAGQMKLLDSYATNKDAAQESAQVAGLEPTKVEYLGAK